MFVSPLNIARRSCAGTVITAALLGLYGVAPAPAQTTLTEAQQTADIIALQNSVALLQTTLSNLQNTANAQAATITALQQKTAPLSLMTDTTRMDGKKNTELYVTGVNVHIVSGSGATSDNTVDAKGNPIAGTSLLGLGNLIIGYNATGNASGDYRVGSHNLVMGDRNNYYSFGGVITGHDNVISGRFALVLSGESNYALADETAVIGGGNNRAMSFQTSLLGGYYNVATSRFGTVVGGTLNTAGGPDDPTIAAATTVTGGYNNYAGGQNAVVSGGQGVIQWSGFGWAAGSQGSQNYWFSNFRSP
jgi:hypothetical protein